MSRSRKKKESKIKKMAINKGSFVITTLAGALIIAVVAIIYKSFNPGDYQGEQLREYFVKEIESSLKSVIDDTTFSLSYSKDANSPIALNKGAYIVTGTVDNGKRAVVVLFERKNKSVIQEAFSAEPPYQLSFLRLSEAISASSILPPEFEDINCDGEIDIVINIRQGFADRIVYYSLAIIHIGDSWELLNYDTKEIETAISEDGYSYIDKCLVVGLGEETDQIVLGGKFPMSFGENPLYGDNDVLLCVSTDIVNDYWIMLRPVKDVCLLDPNWNNGRPLKYGFDEITDEIIDEKWGVQYGNKVFYREDITQEEINLSRERKLLESIHIGMNKEYLSGIAGVPRVDVVDKSSDINYCFYSTENTHFWCGYANGELKAFVIICDTEKPLVSVDIQTDKIEEDFHRSAYITTFSYNDYSDKSGEVLFVNPASGVVRYYSEIYYDSVQNNHDTLVLGNFMDIDDLTMDLITNAESGCADNGSMRELVKPNAYGLFGIDYEGMLGLIPELDSVREYVDVWYLNS